MADKRAFSPGWFLFDAGGYKYIAGVHPDGADLGRPDLYPSLRMRRARPGDIVLLYGTGFGASDPPTPAGELVVQPGVLVTPVEVRIGGVAAEVLWAGPTGSGLYQFNVRVPEAAAGDQPVVAEIAGFRTQGGAFIAAER